MRRQFAKEEEIYILFFNACAFREVTYLLCNRLNKFSTDCNQFSTIIVNGTLSAELFLKFLAGHDSAENDESENAEFCFVHSLKQLYNFLSEDRKQEIENQIGTLNCDKDALERFLASDENVPNSNQVTWRYLIVPDKDSYEFDINTMIKLIEVLYNLSQKIINSLNNKIKFPDMSSSMLDDKTINMIQNALDNTQLLENRQ
ncbi:MAG: hypothetical protein IJS44_05235 [Clostridia bacterium]|nr:hypothetical protein [Clostridia bacterium]